jgi:glycine cleavage system aminomethyltransferase T
MKIWTWTMAGRPTVAADKDSPKGFSDFSSFHSVGRVYLPPERANAVTALEVAILGERIPAQVAALPLVDPRGETIRA